MDPIKIKLFGDDDNFFVHFSSSELCNTFKGKFTGTLGHTCCSGKGVVIKSFEGVKITSSEQVNAIKDKFK
jgi:hypothetical protein